MAKLPPLSSCLIADQLRPELNGKFTILGFYGIAPRVGIYVPSVPAVLPMAAMLICEPTQDAGDFDLELEVKGPDGEDAVKRVRVSGLVSKPSPGQTYACINFAGIRLEQTGRYALNIWSEGQTHSTSTFECVIGRFVDGVMQQPA